jgi:hypothetical protein
MKKTFYIKTAFLSLLGMSLLSSCLKDSRYVDFAGSKPLIELPAATGIVAGGGPFETEAFNISSTPSTFKIAVNIAAPNPLSTALTVKLGLDTAAITAYNTANGTSYTLLPATDYSSSFTVTIPAGQNIGYVTVSVNTSVIDPTQSYVLPVKITDGGGQQISNYDEILYSVQAKNAYDGEYTVTGTMTDVVVPADTDAYPEDAYLETAGANTDNMFDVGLGKAAHAINGGAGYYGNFDPIFTFDPTTNDITSVTNAYGQGTNSQSRGAALDPTGVNKYTKGTPGAAGSVFQVSYYLTVSGVNRTHFVETWTYKGSR